jgi:hypothetical protein
MHIKTIVPLIVFMMEAVTAVPAASGGLYKFFRSIADRSSLNSL